ncbi:MAG: tail fiber domain-containing protein, partial [Bacteroidia bacterium]|nr:tail fiber domain-containing protein [Bacteroidia bacterium]
MKKNLKHVIPALAFVLQFYSGFSQTWTTSSATGTTVLLTEFNVLGTSAATPLTKKDIMFFTDGNERMRLMGEPGANIGFLGLNTIAPDFMLHLDGDGGILSTNGVVGSGVLLPNGLTGARMFWYPNKAAFRAGEVSAAQWDNLNIGTHSAAFNSENTASGDYSSAFGLLSTSSGQYSFATGFQNISGGAASFSGGHMTTASGTYSFAFGETNFSTGNLSTTFGTEARASGGLDFALGTWVQSTANNSFVLGSGYSIGTTHLLNNIPNSFMIGFNSTIPTFFVESDPIPGLNALGRVGIATTTPQRRLDVFDKTDPQLRLTNATSTFFTDFHSTGLGDLGILPSNSRVGINNTTPGFSLDVTGTARVTNMPLNSTATDVVVSTGPGGQLFTLPISSLPTGSGNVNACSSINPAFVGYLSRWTDDAPAEICNSIVFDNLTNVGIGTTSMIAKLHVQNNTGQLGGVFLTNFPNPQNTGAAALANGGTTGNTGLIGYAIAASNTDVGVQGFASSASVVLPNQPPSNKGGFFTANGTNVNVLNFGVHGVAQGPGKRNVGGFFTAVGGNQNIGVYGSVATNSGMFGAGLPPGPNYAGYFNGDVLITNMYGPSDKNLKKEINEISNATELINKLKPVSYLFDTDKNKSINLPTKKQYGFISQEVEKILPELTAKMVQPAEYDTLGNQVAPEVEYLGLNYLNFIAILTKATQEQQIVIERLQKDNHHQDSLI